MKLLMLSTDTSMLLNGSPSAIRHRAYAKAIEELHVVIACNPSTRQENIDGVHLYPAASGPLPIRFLIMLNRGIHLCRSVRPDIISAEDPGFTGMAGFLLSRLFNLPLQVQLHTDVFNPRYRQASRKERIRFWFARFVVPRATCLRVVSKRLAVSTVEIFGIQPNRIQILPVFTDIEAARNSPKDRSFEEKVAPFSVKIISAGRFVDREKGFGLLIDAFADLHLSMPGAVLIIVGEGPDQPLYKKKIEALGLHGNVVLEDWKEDLASILKACDIYVQPSYYEGWGRTCIEAAAAGLPVIMTDVGLAGEVFKGQGDSIIVPVGDRRALATAIHQLGRDPDLRALMAETSQEAIERLPYQSMHSYCQAYLRAIEVCSTANNARL